MSVEPGSADAQAASDARVAFHHHAPLGVVWDALERHDCDPHGVAHDFRASCPGHDGDNCDALHVTVGADDRALVHCFAHGCEPELILGRIGLTVRDLFPPGHRRARRVRLASIRRDEMTGTAREFATVLAALDTAGVPWQALVTTVCPSCGCLGAWVRARAPHAVYIDCPSGCDTRTFTEALAARITPPEEVSDERRAA